MSDDQAPKIASTENLGDSLWATVFGLVALVFMGCGFFVSMYTWSIWNVAENIMHQIFAALLSLLVAVCFVGSMVCAGFALLFGRR